MEIRSYAKINLILKILGRRSDGYHDLLSLFQRIDLFDLLMFRAEKEGIALVSDWKELPCGASNLVYRAAELILRESGIRSGVSISLQKNIPIGAGLGGGSSNAAFTLIAINRLFGLNYSSSDLAKFGEVLGSDVPFFCREIGAAWVSGRGEKVEQAEFHPEMSYLLVFPGFSVSTREAYGLWDEAHSRDKNELTKKGVHNTISGFQSGIYGIAPEAWVNDFEEIVIPRHPGLRKIREGLIQAGAKRVLLSGSGSTLFGGFSSGQSAREAAARMEKEFSGCWIRVARGV